MRVIDQYGDQHAIRVPIERPLRILLDGREITTLWTLGASPAWLVTGYLWSRQLITDVTGLESITVDWPSGAATVRTQAPAAGAQQRPALAPAHVSGETVLAMLANLPQDGGIYRAAGAVHGCALFEGPELWASVEDVSRRNALDIVTGWMLLHGVTGAGKILFMTGRLTAETVLKAAQLAIPTVVSRKGLTSACVDVAARLGMSLFGHAARGRYLCYTCAPDQDRQELEA